MMQPRTDIVISGAFERYGGVGRLLVNQIRFWDEWGYRVELIGYRNSVLFYPEEMPEAVRFTDLRTSGKWPTLVQLWLHLYRTQPKVVLGTSHLSNMILTRCRRMPGLRTRFYLGVHHTLASNSRPARQNRKTKRQWQVRRAYARADGIVAVSPALADELREFFGLVHLPVTAIYNGVVTQELFELAKHSVDHPWMRARNLPVILAAGHLSRAKDHATLLRAFQRVLQSIDCRLIIIGEGTERKALERQIREQGCEERVDLPGFQENPYAWMARADLFVLSSRSEGMSNVLAEALSLGVPIVSTDCPTGPRDVLGGGRYGELVPVGDDQAMARAMEKALDQTSRLTMSDKAIAPFRAEYAARAYTDFFRLPQRSSRDPVT